MELREYITSAITSRIQSANQIDKTLHDNFTKMQTIGSSVSSRKRNEEGLKYSDVAKDLEEIQEKHYTSFFLEQSMKTIVSEIKLLDTIAKEFKVEPELSDDDKMKLNFIIENNTDVYTIVNGKVEIANNELYQQISEALKKKVSEENSLQQMFNNIQ